MPGTSGTSEQSETNRQADELSGQSYEQFYQSMETGLRVAENPRAQRRSQEPQATSTAATAAAETTDQVETPAVGSELPAQTKKTKWTSECAATLPKFSLVREQRKTVEQWVAAVLKVLSEYWGPEGLIRNSIVEAVDLPELRRASFDVSDYTILSLLKFISEVWNRMYAPSSVEVVLRKRDDQSWCDFIEELRTWATKKGIRPNNAWYLDQMRANIDVASDCFRGQKMDAGQWAIATDALLSTYNRVRHESVATIGEEKLKDKEQEEEEPEKVDAVFKGGFRPTGKHKFTASGKPICDICHGEGHVARQCPSISKRYKSRGRRGGRKNFNGNARLVYTINENESEPIVIAVNIGAQVTPAMLDSGAMENVIDIKFLRKYAPHVRLGRCSKRLFGADKKPIHVVGASFIPIKIDGIAKQLYCVAVANLNTDLIIGMPGLRKLGLTVNFERNEVIMGDKRIYSVKVGEPSSTISTIQECNIDSTLTEEQKQQMREVTQKWAHTLVEKIQDRGPAKGYKFSIDTGNTKPIYVPLRTYSPKEQEELDRQVDEMLRTNIITRVRSPWSAPVLLVKKKDATYRVVVDYTRLNAKTEDDSFPLPVPKTTFQALNNARYFSTLDLASGYWQVEIDEKDIPKTAFNTRKGTFAFLRMPMGLKNAPAAFQRFMTEIFSDLMYKGVLVFIDDILIYSTTWEKHLKLVDEVLKRLSEHNLQAKIGKCHFGAKETKYLGSVISYRCRKPDPDKVKAIKQLQSPKSKDEVRSLLGLASFYREFIPNLSAIAEPIQKLMKKDVQFEWGTEQQKALDTIKQSISEKSCLEIPEPSWKYELHTDASLSGLGAVLFQRDPSGKLHTIEFASKSLTKAQRKQAIPVLECYAIVWALQKFRCYIHGVHVDIYTDHFSLQFLNRNKDPPAKFQRWWWDIADYDFDIHYKEGSKNVADVLSRLMPQSQLEDDDKHDLEVLNSIISTISKFYKVFKILEKRKRGDRWEYLVRWNNPSGPKSWESKHSIHNPDMVQRFEEWWEAREKQMEQELAERKRKEMTREEVLAAQKEDPECRAIVRALNGGKSSKTVRNDADQCLMVEGTLYHRDIRRKSIDGQLQLVVPKAFREQLIEEIHGGVLGGHFGVQRTLDAVRRYYWWHGLKKDIEEVIQACPECNARNPNRGSAKPLLQPEERTGIPWERVGIDYTDMAKSTEGYSKLLVMIDHATKFVIAKPTKDGSAETAAKLLFEELICKYGAPKELWSDRGKSFLGEVVGYLAKLFDIKRKYTSGYHPQTNGLTERFNRTITNELAKTVRAKKEDWPTWLQAKVFAYNTTAQKATGYSPFELIHTFTPRTPIDNELALPPDSFKKKDWAQAAFKRAQEMREDALKNQKAAAESQKRAYDKGLKPVKFNVGDYVRVLDLTAEAKQPVKLRNQYVGPFRVRGRKGMLFELEDEKGARLKGLYHPVKLKLVNAEGNREKWNKIDQPVSTQQVASTEGDV